MKLFNETVFLKFEETGSLAAQSGKGRKPVTEEVITNDATAINDKCHRELCW